MCYNIKGKLKFFTSTPYITPPFYIINGVIYMFILADIWPDLYCIVVFRQAFHNAPIIGVCVVAVGATAIVCGAYSEKR